MPLPPLAPFTFVYPLPPAPPPVFTVPAVPAVVLLALAAPPPPLPPAPPNTMLLNNQLKIFPIPDKDFKLWIDYIIKEERSNPLKYANGTVSDMSNAPYSHMKYQHINSVGRRWIFKYTLALSKENL